MGLPECSHAAKANAFLSCAAFIVYVVGLASPNWLEKDFDYPLNIGGVVALPVKAKVGLFVACKVETYLNNKTFENCSPEGAADWQYIAAALAIIAVVAGLVAALLSILSVVVRRLVGKLKLKLPIMLFHFIACGVMVGPLLLFPIHKVIIVKPTVSDFHVDFDLGWSYKVAGAGSGMFALIVLYDIMDLIWSCDTEDKLSKYRNI